MKNLFILLVGIILVSAVPAVHAQKIWSLQNCIDYAIENNIQIKQQALNNQYQQNLLHQAKSDRLPSLNGQVGNNYNFGRSLTYENTYENVNSTSLSGGLGANITLFNGFSLKNTIAQRELDLQASLQEIGHPAGHARYPSDPGGDDNSRPYRHQHRRPEDSGGLARDRPGRGPEHHCCQAIQKRRRLAKRQGHRRGQV